MKENINNNSSNQTHKSANNVNKLNNEYTELNTTYLSIKNFKNLNFSQDNDRNKTILLNSSLAKYNLRGDLFFILGLNNVGKTNVLNALNILGGGREFIFGKDTPNFVLDLDNVKYIPKICLDEYLKNKKTRSIIATELNANHSKKEENSTEGVQRIFSTYCVRKDLVNAFNTEYTKNSLFAEINYESDIYNICINCGEFVFEGSKHKCSYLSQIKTQPVHDRNKIVAIEITSKIGIIRNFNLIDSVIRRDDDVFEIGKNKYKLFLEGNVLFHKVNNNKIMFLFELSDNLLGNNFKIKWFDYKSYNNQDFIENWDLFSQNQGFVSQIFKLININSNELMEKNKLILKSDNPINKYRQLENAVNKKLEQLSQEFNNILISNNRSYKFTCYINDKNIQLCFEEDGNSIDFELQSDGFKWFFSFFMWMKTNNQLGNGDIVLIDETFGNNITPKSVIELRRKLKEFSYKTGISFVISTHNPFLIDLNYLEEIRIVKKQNDNSSIIMDKFHTIYKNFDISLQPVLETFSLTSNVFYDKENTRTYFVEGITDYCYLTAMSIKLGIKNLLFLPIQGLYNQNMNVYKKLEKNPRFLVDGDKAGIDFKERLKSDKNVKVLKLSDVNESFVAIETLFVETFSEDIAHSKSFENAVALKKAIINNNLLLSEQTIKNFTDLFKALLN
ncbi:AAA family ATPase [Mycoplasma zalophi]|uniref:AAA family ATPase n=1 Tax=Mycoplasma zalophi TaxID=191287 RepID=UPI001C11508F|nr:AAA family ATPase [Mycoplasma zalophi]MBU4691106.1 ATP-binding protein [Mycoplasma zalophi]